MKTEQNLLALLKEDVSRFNADALRVHEAVSKSKAIYKGEPVPYLYLPRIFDPEDMRTFETAIQEMHALCQHVIELYEAEPEIRAFYHFDPRLDALIRKPHHYKTTVPMGRFDIFYYGDGAYQFCELNADGASAMNEEFELSKILAHTEAMRAFPFAKKPEPCELFESWGRELVTIYDEYLAAKGLTPKHGKNVRVAIVDILEKGSSIEFEMFQDAFTALGLESVIIDARELNYENGVLLAEGKPVDIVYRRLVTKDFMDAYDVLGDLIAAINEDAVCVVGSLKTQIIHTKRFFELLYAPVLQPFLSESEKAFIAAHVPFTAKLTEAPEYLSDKDAYIIKPVDYYASKGVCAGRDYSAEAWEALLSDKYDGSHVIQKYCPYALVDNAVLVEGSLQVETFRHITGLFTYNGKLSGLYSRAGRNAIISGLHDGFTLSSLVIE